MRVPPLAWRLSPQLYAWTVRGRADPAGLLPAFVEVGLDDAAAATYEGVELALSIVRTKARAAKLEGTLAARGLRLAGLFAQLDERTPEAELHEVARRAADGAVADCRTIIVATTPAPVGRRAGSDHEHGPKLLARLAPIVAAHGLETCWHPHVEHLENDGAGLRRFLCEVDTVRICLDLGWVIRAQADPARLLDACGGRLGALHLRDASASRWREAVGTGDLDLAQVADRVVRSSFDGWVTVELWFERATAVTRPLRDNALASATAIRRACNDRFAAQVTTAHETGRVHP